MSNCFECGKGETMIYIVAENERAGLDRTNLFCLCHDCMRNISKLNLMIKINRSIEKSKYPLGLFKGEPIHKMDREQMAKVILFLAEELIRTRGY